MQTAEQLRQVIEGVHDQQSFIQNLLRDTLNWPINLDFNPDIGDITYEWTDEELQSEGLSRDILAGPVLQMQSLEQDNEQPWGIFILEFQNEKVFTTGRGLTGPLRKVLRGLCRRKANLPTWDRENLLFICTHNYKHFKFAYFKSPKEKGHAAPLTTFGWEPDTPARTTYENLCLLEWPDDITSENWLSKWTQAFDVEKVNKKFYTQIAQKFTDLIGGWLKTGSKKYEREGCLVWPENSDEKRKEFAVRLIGRLVFCWFLKKKHSEPANIPLIPKNILSLKAANNNDSYYHFVLEPLFFEVLNKKLNDRHKNYKTNGWDKIPFLNGGLFTPHSDDYYDPDDFQGISPRGDVKVPDGWLRELLEIFERYNFTIDENTPVDIEISIDPEMLGRIFENLLAMINPETGETVRKSTGSYYTPRPIVEYMVDESVKQYLLTQTDVPEDKIKALLDYSLSATDTDLTDKQNDSVINALDKLKVLDPACGSGAFPIGTLQKILLILEKIDPDSKKWKTRLLAKIPNSTARKALAEKLETETWQYIHKLGVIQNSIYGVDIQPIAAEISKLRAFLSLVVDETVNDTAENRGILSLPNLEFKFVCANTLIGLPETESQKGKMRGKKLVESKGQTSMFEATDEIAELKKVIDNYFTSYGEEKIKLEQQFNEIQSKLRQHMLNSGQTDTQTAKLADWNPFGHESCPWFDPEWMFCIKEGFDIVIGNPPYVVTKDRLLRNIYRESVSGRTNLYGYFIHRALLTISTKGVVCFINPKTILTDAYFSSLRKYIINNTSVQNILNITDRRDVFENVLQSVIVNIFGRNSNITKIKNIKKKEDIYTSKNIILKNDSFIYNKNNNPIFIVGEDKTAYKVFDKIRQINSLEDEGIKFVTGKIQWDLYRDYLAPSPKKTATRLIWAENIQRYYYKQANIRANKLYINTRIKDSISPIENPTIIVQRTTAVEQEWRIIATLIKPLNFTHPVQSENHTSYIIENKNAIGLNYILACLNSKLYDYIFRHINSNTQVSSGELNSLPFVRIAENQQRPFVELVDKILAKKQAGEDTTAEEAKIDRMVYDLYGLTDEEIAIVEDKTE